MTTTEDGVDAELELEEAIAENPEAVAEFVQRLDAVNELLDVLALGEDAMTDEMARELADTTSTLAESADGLATQETVDLAEAVGENGTTLREALETVVQLQERGTLDDLAELAEVGALAGDAMNDEMVRTLASTGTALGEVADTAATEETRNGLTTVLEGLGAAETKDPERVGMVGLLRGVRDPEVQYGLGYILAIARAIGEAQAGDEAAVGR
jgi:uncharacterized protein YjgD (DUF1641 family)